MDNNSQIIIYRSEDGDIKIDVRFDGDTVWLTQAQLVDLYQSSKPNISEHIKNIFSEGELDEKVVVRKFRTTSKHGAIKGKTQTREVNLYNLDMIISLGYRIKSHIATNFRIWATGRLKEYIVKGFALNDERFKSGKSMNYFAELQDRIRAIRLSERFFYQKIKDIYTTSVDYDPADEKTIKFFKIVQNKLLWAISLQTAAELIYDRVSAEKPLLGMQSYDKNESVIKKTDVGIAKNYLNEDEIKLLKLLVDQYLTFAETMAQQQNPMSMTDWIQQLDIILKMNKKELLTHAGKISHILAKIKSEKEFEKFSVKHREIEKAESLKELEEDLKKIKS